MSILAIGGEFFTEFFSGIGFSTYKYRGECKEVLKYIEEASLTTKVFILSEKIDAHCLTAIKKFLDERNLTYIILPETDELDESKIDDYYDRILKSLIGI